MKWNSAATTYLLILFMESSVQGFQTLSSRHVSTRLASTAGDPQSKRKRRKRKEPSEPAAAVIDDNDEMAVADPIPLQPRDRGGVVMPMENVMPQKDEGVKRPPPPAGDSIQDLVNGYTASEEKRTDENDPLAMMLQDAKAMGAKEASSKDEEEGTMAIVKNIISTIVTVDFFVVCALLVWFLAGIASSALLKNDSVQLAFNGIFEPVVQPALGILMIASISDAVLKPKEDDEGDVLN